MEPRPKPGRDDLGRWITNDATGKQATDLLADALDAHMAGEEDLARTLIEEARAASALADAGTRPATPTEDHGDD